MERLLRCQVHSPHDLYLRRVQSSGAQVGQRGIVWSVLTNRCAVAELVRSDCRDGSRWVVIPKRCPLAMRGDRMEPCMAGEV